MTLLVPETIDIKSLPMMGIRERKRLPNICAIYFVLDSENTIVYIGKTNSLNTRMAFHEKFWAFEEANALSIAWIAVEDELSLPFIEEDFIAYYRPRLNKRDFRYRNNHQVAFALDHTIVAKARYLMKTEGIALSDFVAQQIEHYVNSRATVSA